MLAKIFSRKSTKNTCRRSISPEDFNDVFGGPPRSVFSRKPSDYFYDDMFHYRRSEDINARILPHFNIGRGSQVLCAEMFDEVRTSNFDTTSEEFSPPITDNAIYSPLHSSLKLRPIILQPEWNTSSILMHGAQQEHQDTPDFTYSRPSFVGYQFTDEEQTDYTSGFHNDDDDTDDDDSEISSSYVSGFNYSYREGSDEGVRVDEAIAWAKESYLSHTSSAETTEMPDGSPDGSESLQLHEEDPNKMKTEKDQREVDESRKMKMLEENIKLWSSGKERNIELLLSTLQDILWRNSGWYPIPHTDLYQSSNVKKAYQKARLRLHPDKLQQRGATLFQKCAAERIFLILQEAWDAYTSQDIIVSSQG